MARRLFEWHNVVKRTMTTSACVYLISYITCVQTGPVEEAYAIMQKFNVKVNPEEINKVDTLRYSWNKLLSKANEVSGGN